MKIAQVAPLHESVPPKLYGGTERVVYFLTEELVRRGHQVTLFASGDSHTSARLIPACSKSLRLDPKCQDQLAHHILLLDEVFSRQHEFDLIHFHSGYLHFPLCRYATVPRVTTLHGRLDIPDLQPLMKKFSDAPLISISDAQRAPLTTCNWQGTVYHGLPKHRYKFSPRSEGYFAFLGRASPEKGLDQAIEIAKRAGKNLKIAAKVDDLDREYFQKSVAPLLSHPLVQFVGEIGCRHKNAFLAGASALLFPINWPEPFGLVMIEALACGTPVIAYNRGSVPEIIEYGVSGFIVDDADAAVNAAHHIGEIDRRRCRDCFERRFTVGRMTNDYLKIYSRLPAATESLISPPGESARFPGLQHSLGDD